MKIILKIADIVILEYIYLLAYYLKCLVLLVVFSRLENSIYALLILAYFLVYEMYNFSLSYLYFADLSVL